MSRVVVDGWAAGFRKISFVHLLRDRAGWGLAEAKHACDLVLDEEAVYVSFTTVDAATAFVSAAVHIGALARLIGDPALSRDADERRDG